MPQPLPQPLPQADHVLAIEVNPNLIGFLFTDRDGDTLRVFCYYTNGDTSQFDVPVDENLEAVTDLFSRLKMEESGSSVIVDEMIHNGYHTLAGWLVGSSMVKDDLVEGRVYVKSGGKHWLYTFISMPDRVFPPFNADLSQLPWQVVWKTQELEVLQYGSPGETKHRFAIRTVVNEGNVARLVKAAKALTNPVSKPVSPPAAVPGKQKERSSRFLYLNLGVMLLTLGLMAGWALHPNLHVGDRGGESTASANNYYLLNNHQIIGPYSLKSVVEISASGLLKGETLCRADNSTEWVNIASLIPAKSKQ
jgi:hypothetical protein